MHFGSHSVLLTIAIEGVCNRTIGPFRVLGALSLEISNLQVPMRRTAARISFLANNLRIYAYCLLTEGPSGERNSECLNRLAIVEWRRMIRASYKLLRTHSKLQSSTDQMVEAYLSYSMGSSLQDCRLAGYSAISCIEQPRSQQLAAAVCTSTLVGDLGR